MAEGMVSVITAVTNGIKNYVLTPDEARSIVEMKWADFEADVDLEALEEDDWDDLDRINIREAGRGPQDDEPVNQERIRENPTMQNGGGQPAGQTRDPQQPTRDKSLDSPSQSVELSDEQMNEIIDGLADRLTE